MNAASQGQEIAVGSVRHPRRDRIGPLTDVNTLCLQWLVEGARHPSQLDAKFLDELSGSLSALSEAELLRAAQVPFLLVDLRFHDHEWWISHTALQPSSQQAAPLPGPLRDTTTVGLARSTLVLAWHTTRVDRDAALVMLGLSPAVAELLSQIHLQDIDSIAARHYQELQPRWTGRMALWKQILVSASAHDSSDSHVLALQCLSLVAGELLPASG